MSQYAAIPETPNIRPAFTVRKLEGTFPYTIHMFDKENNRILGKVENKPAGYLVTFARGHSIRALNEDHLRAIGVGTRMVPLVDTETGDVKGSVPNSVDLEAA